MRPKKEISKPKSAKDPARRSSATTPEYTHYAHDETERVIGAPDAGDEAHDSPWGPASRTARKP